MDEITLNGPSRDVLDRRAAALAELTKMQSDLMTAHDDVRSMERDLAREQDRVALLIEERDRYRHEASVFRSKLIELATAMANIGLLTIQAQEILKSAQEMLAANFAPSVSESQTTNLEGVRNGS